MKKDPKATELKLARGPITPEEFSDLMNLAASGTDFMHLYTSWRDGSTASITQISDLEPIADPARIDYANGTFRFTDGSKLKILLTGLGHHTITASGEKAREKQDAISQYWAKIPGRGRLGFQLTLYLLCFTFGPAFTNLVLLIIGTFDAHNRASAGWWTLHLALVFIPASIFLLLLRTDSVRGFRSVIVLVRRNGPRADVWVVVGVILAFATLCFTAYMALSPNH